ncbi:MAG: hypothetical protein ABI725_06170 [Chloroflexota bacterium]
MARRDDLLNGLAMGEWFRQFKRTGTKWIGTIQPRVSGLKFKVEIDTAFHPPVVRVLDPPLVNESGKSLPKHHFADRTLCLYHRDDPGWDRRKPIALTILPWIFEWCYFYELWLETGVWYGIEYAHAEEKAREQADQAGRDAAA